MSNVTITQAITVLWVPSNGPYFQKVYYGTNVNYDTANSGCILNKVTACKTNNYLVYVKFWFTGSGCTDKEFIMRNISECSPASNMSEHAITGPVTHFKGYNKNNYVSGFKLLNAN